jgi:hypothetical protein
MPVPGPWRARAGGTGAETEAGRVEVPRNRDQLYLAQGISASTAVFTSINAIDPISLSGTAVCLCLVALVASTVRRLRRRVGRHLPGRSGRAPAAVFLSADGSCVKRA